jgi:hypothetical protein
VGDRITVLSRINLVGANEALNVTGPGLFAGSIYAPLPVIGGAIWAGLIANLPSEGHSAGGYYYELTVTSASSNLVAADIAATILTPAYRSLTGPYVVNFTAASGCVLATGPINSTAYAVPTLNACSSGILGATARVVAGDSIDIYSTVSLSGASNWFAVYGHGPYDSSFFWQIS